MRGSLAADVVAVEAAVAVVALPVGPTMVVLVVAGTFNHDNSSDSRE